MTTLLGLLLGLALYFVVMFIVFLWRGRNG